IIVSFPCSYSPNYIISAFERVSATRFSYTTKFNFRPLEVEFKFSLEKERIIEKLFPQDIVGEYFLPYNVLSLMHDYQTLLKFTTIEHKEDGMLVEIAGEEKYMHVFEKYKVKGEHDEKNSMGKA
ncbi:MAG: hypothetical protein IJ875_00280, partial [Solobacterium sp.]|nr:hypothetical protein [Solobacterium sp.]